jgi:hypothetical protein
VLLIGLVRAIRLRGPTDAVFVAFALVALSTNWLVLLFPKDFLRTAALPLALVPFVLGAQTGAGARITSNAVDQLTEPTG